MVRGYVLLCRPQNVVGIVLTFAIGYVLAGGSWSADLTIGLLIIALLHSLANVQNDIEDLDIDKANKRRGALQSGEITMQQAKMLAAGLATGAVGLALLAPQRQLHLLVVASLLVIVWLYNSPPIQASKRPILSILVLSLCFGAIPFVYGYLLAGGEFEYSALAIGAALFMGRVSTTILKDYKDAAGDKKHNKLSFYLRYGLNTTYNMGLSAAITAYTLLLTSLVILADKSTGFAYAVIALAILLAAGSLRLRLQLKKAKDDNARNLIFHQIVPAHNQFELVVLLWLILF